MSRHGKSKGGKSHRGKPRRVKEAKPQKSVLAEATGALPREDVVRELQALAPARTLVAARADSVQAPPAMDSAVETLQRSFQAARQGTVEVNRMLIDIGRQSVASGLDFARSLAAAKSPIEAARLQLAFFDERMKALLHHAAELRALSADHLAKASEPIREHMRLSLGARAS